MLQSFRRVGSLVACLVLLLAGIALQISAQEVTARIKGVVTDASGSAVPDALVKATNTQTGVSRTVSSADNGSFQFLQLPVGNYDVSITKGGFQTYNQSGILLVLNEIYTIPAKLAVGTVSQSVDVNANPAQVETSSTQLGTIIEAKQIVDLPLNGRNWTQLQQLVPGVVASSDRLGGYATNGNQSQQNSFLINGNDTNYISLNVPLIIPSPDAVGEFNLISSTINPEYGRNSGGVLNAVIKSGTNQFHGDAFEFYRDTFLNGRNLFQATKPVFHQNQFGGTLGGPVWKNHTFFFLSYQGTRNRAPSGANTTTVFSPAQRNGIFDLSNSTGSSPIPLTGESGIVYPAGTPYTTIFPTGHIPVADFNPISANLLNKYVPLPNSPGNLFAFNPVSIGTQDQGIARIDHTFGNSDTVWGSLFFENHPTASTLPFDGASLPGFGELDTEFYQTYAADWTHTFNPTALNELRASFVRFNYGSVNPATPSLPSNYGFTGITPQYPAGAGAPFISLNGYFDLGFSAFGPQPDIQNTYQLTDSFSKVIGNHSLKFGFSGTRYDLDNLYFSRNNGAYTFGGSGIYSTGDPGADFLLGIPDQYLQGSGAAMNERTYEYYMYAQDSWKVKQNFTVNYGVGYQIDTPLQNLRYHGEALNCFRPGQQSTVFPTAPQGLVFPGDKGCSASGYYTHYDNLGPRFGFAWAPGSDAAKKLSIRGGFGIYFNRTEEELALQNLGAAPFSENSYGAGALPNGSPGFADPFVDISTGQRVANPFPFTPPTSGANVDFSQFLPLDINVIDPNFTDPYAMNYNLNVQYELPSAMVLQVGYVGSLGRHLELTYEGDPITQAGAANCLANPDCVSSRVSQHTSFPENALYEPSYPGGLVPYASVGTQATVGVSSYHSLQVSLNKRLTHGLQFQAAYTWSHAIDDTSGYENSANGIRSTNPFNFAMDKGDSSYDARQRFVINYDYEIPHLSRYWNNPLTRTVLDGWHLAGITTLQTGFPITIGDSNFQSLTCDSYAFYGCWDRPNQAAPNQTYNPRNSVLVNTTRGGTGARNYYYFDPNAFAVEPFGTLGNAGRNNLHGPGINNTDLSLSKRVYFDKSEKRLIELRLEGYNLFNHTQFTRQFPTASSDINSGNFGRILSATSGRTVQLGAKFYF